MIIPVYTCAWWSSSLLELQTNPTLPMYKIALPQVDVGGGVVDGIHVHRPTSSW